MRHTAFRTAALAMLIALMAMASLAAGGSGEDDTIAVTTNVNGKEYTAKSIADIIDNSTTSVGGFFASVSGVYDEITMAFCLGLTPFPNTLVQFYDGYGTAGYDVRGQMDSATLDRSLLIGDGYYSTNGGVLNYGSRNYPGKSADTQRSTWNMVSVLFVSFLLAEIVFTAVYHYVSDKDGSVLKEVLAKSVMAIAIFLVAASLPFLIEMLRIGFVSAAATVTGIDELATTAEHEQESSTPTVDEMMGLDDMDLPVVNTQGLTSLQEMRALPVFSYPGVLIRSMGDLFGFMNPDNVGGSGVSIDEEVDAGVLMNVLMEVVYLFVKLVATVMVLIAALHVMYNVCEVYLLLGCVMVLLPFTVFSPLKFLGEKAVMSLFANVVELFVIVMIMFSTMSIAFTVSSGLLASLLSNIKSVTVEMSVVHPELFIEAVGYSRNDTVINYLNPFKQDDGSVRLVAYLPGPEGYGKNGSIFQESFNEAYTSAGAGWLPELQERLSKWFNDNWKAMVEAFKTENPTELYKLSSTLKLAYDSNGYPADQYLNFLASTNFDFLPAKDKYAVVSYLAGTAGQAMGMSVSKTPEVDRSVDPTLGATDIYLMHITSFLLIILMQTYFLNQSSQITNALLSGNVSSEGFTGALTRMAAGKMVKSGLKKATAPLKGLGGLGRTAMGIYGAKHGGSALGKAMNLAAGQKGRDNAEALGYQKNQTSSGDGEKSSGDGGKSK